MGILEEELLLQPEKKEDDIIKIENKKKSSLSIDSIINEIGVPNSLSEFFLFQKEGLIPHIHNWKTNLFSNNEKGIAQALREGRDILHNQAQIILEEKSIQTTTSWEEEIIAGDFDVDIKEAIPLNFTTRKQLTETIKLLNLRKYLASENDVDISNEIDYINNTILELFEFDEMLDRIKKIYLKYRCDVD